LSFYAMIDLEGRD